MAFCWYVTIEDSGIDYIDATAGGLDTISIATSDTTCGLNDYAEFFAYPSSGNDFSHWTYKIGYDGALQTSYDNPLIIYSTDDDIFVWPYSTSSGSDGTIYYAYLDFDANGGTNTGSMDYGLEEWSTDEYVMFEIPDVPPVRDGYEFLYWTLDVNGKGDAYYGGDIIYLWGTTDENWPAEHTLYAQWGSNRRYAKIVFNANGGTNTTILNRGLSSANGDGETSGEYVIFTLPNSEPTRDGYSLSGWCLNSDGSTTLYQPGDNLTLWGGSSSSAMQSYTLYAIWVIESTGDGFVYIHNGTRWVAATPYIHNGTKWVVATPYIHNGSEWVIATS